MKSFLLLFLALRCAAAADYFVYVSNERSGDVSVIDGARNEVVARIPVGKRPRGIHTAPDGKHVYVTLSGSPRMGPGVDRARAVADKSADGIGVIDTTTHKMLVKFPVGSDPEQFAITKDGRYAVVANEDRATASIVELATGKPTGEVNVSAEPEGVSVNPGNGFVYVTCEEQGDVFVIEAEHAFSPSHFKVGARP